jgi:hypothetical protein
MGFNAGRYITAGGNTMVGAKTGLSYWNTGVDGQVNLTTGAGNTIIGCNAGVNNAARKQAIVLGKDATALNDGELVLGAPLVGIRGGKDRHNTHRTDWSHHRANKRHHARRLAGNPHQRHALQNTTLPVNHHTHV